MTEVERDSELRPAYRTLSEPTMVLGLALSGWAALLAAGAIGYGWLLISPLPWRLNTSLVIIGLGAPIALLLLREGTAISPSRVLAAAVRWRLRASTVTHDVPASDGAVRLTTTPPSADSADLAAAPLWLGGAGEPLAQEDGS